MNTESGSSHKIQAKAMTIDNVIAYHTHQIDLQRKKYIEWVNIRNSAKKSNYELYVDYRVKYYKRYVTHREILKVLEGLK